jgi:hypothetical protein
MTPADWLLAVEVAAAAGLLWWQQRRLASAVADLRAELDIPPVGTSGVDTVDLVDAAGEQAAAILAPDTSQPAREDGSR